MIFHASKFRIRGNYLICETFLGHLLQGDCNLLPLFVVLFWCHSPHRYTGWLRDSHDSRYRLHLKARGAAPMRPHALARVLIWLEYALRMRDGDSAVMGLAQQVWYLWSGRSLRFGLWKCYDEKSPGQTCENLGSLMIIQGTKRLFSTAKQMGYRTLCRIY